jgi:2-oxoglutarate dehydrogenase E2 component (dihydrolipoamide succinyltransferase)
MSIPVQMPQMGESVVEGTLERWLVQEGDRVEKDQTLCEITTDKVDAEVAAPESGVVVSILVAAGQTVNVGTELARIDPSAKGSASAKKPSEKQASKEAAKEGSKKGEAAAEKKPAAEPARSGDRAAQESRPAATPMARRVADEKGVDVRSVSGSGAAGRVTKTDVESAVQGDAKSTPKEEPASGLAAAPGTLGAFLAGMKIPVHKPREGDQVTPFSAVRRRIAEHMVVSKIVSPHVGTVAEVDLHALVRLRDARKRAFKEEHGFNLTFLPFIVQATVRALKAFPRMNATVVGESIVERGGFHIGVAVETDRGLLVPVIRDAERLSLLGVAQAIEDLARRAREREITADELQGGTFTVTNPGREGNLYGFAVINQPQVGILRMGEVKKRPVVVERDGEDTIAIHPMMYLALSYDHRIIDGVTGNGFLYRVAKNLEEAEFEV